MFLLNSESIPQQLGFSCGRFPLYNITTRPMSSFISIALLQNKLNGRPNPPPPSAERIIAKALTSGNWDNFPLISFIKSKVNALCNFPIRSTTMAIPHCHQAWRSNYIRLFARLFCRGNKISFDNLQHYVHLLLVVSSPLELWHQYKEVSTISLGTKSSGILLCIETEGQTLSNYHQWKHHDWLFIVVI